MKLPGSLSELVSAIFRKNSQAITLRPNQSTTYTAVGAGTEGPGLTVTTRTTTTGFKVTANEAGLYSVSASSAPSNATPYLGITKNGTSLSTALPSVPSDEVLAEFQGTAGYPFVSWTGFLASGDIIRIQEGGAGCTSGDANAHFHMVQLSRF